MTHLQGLIASSELLFATKQEVDALRAVICRGRGAQHSWSQFGEDLLLSRELGDCIESGYYVDVGANHPVKISNTYRLYCMGMRGITVEPNPALCRLHSRYRPGDVQLCSGIGSTDGPAVLYRMSYHGLSTLSADECERQVRNGQQMIGKFVVPVFRLRTVLDAIRLPGRETFALLSVDTEGLDEVVLRSNDWTKYRPRLIAVENNTGDSSIRRYLEQFGYCTHATSGCNEILRLRT